MTTSVVWFHCTLIDCFVLSNEGKKKNGSRIFEFHTRKSKETKAIWKSFRQLLVSVREQIRSSLIMVIVRGSVKKLDDLGSNLPLNHEADFDTLALIQTYTTEVF